MSPAERRESLSADTGNCRETRQINCQNVMSVMLSCRRVIIKMSERDVGHVPEIFLVLQAFPLYFNLFSFLNTIAGRPATGNYCR